MSAASPRLSEKTLSRASAALLRPDYDRRATRIGTVHIGPGAFHRAHQAYFIDRLLTRDPERAISAVSLRSADVHDALAPQDCLYVLAELGEDSSYRAIGAIREIIVANRTPERVMERLVAVQTKLVTMTVTEKGYCLDSAGALDFTHADIVHDLSAGGVPRSVIGWLVSGLSERRRTGIAPFVTISCDNLLDNGSKLGRAVIAFAAAKDKSLAAWIEDRAQFPNTMVDGITPATDVALRSRVTAATGLVDAWPVQRESFAQWVIEKTAGADMPDWESVGVTVAQDVAPFSRAKLRMLNAAHSALAYLGLLAGYASVADAVSDSRLRGFIERMLRDDVSPCLRAAPGLDLARYRQSVLARFANPAIRHELAQIAMDGSKKIPERILATCVEATAAGRSLERLAVPVAAWMAFIVKSGVSHSPIRDPLAAELQSIAEAASGDATKDVARFLALAEIFRPEVAALPGFRHHVEQAYAAIAQKGALAAADV